MKTEYRRQETEYSKIRGVTMAEADAYYEGLLKEIKELETLLKESEDGKESREEINQRG